jgi:hypothetical protein
MIIMTLVGTKFSDELRNRFDSRGRVRSEIFYLVTSPINDSIFEPIDILRWEFGFDLHSNVRNRQIHDSAGFRFSRSYPYSIYTSLMDGYLDVNLRYLIFLSILHESVVLDFTDLDDLEFQIYMDLQSFYADLDVLISSIYFIGFGPDQLLSYDEFNCFIQYLTRFNFGPNSWMVSSVIYNLCFSFLKFTKFD